LSIGNFVAGILTRCPEIHDFLEARDDSGRLNIFRKYQFSDLSAFLSAFNDFMRWSEETSVNLSTAWGKSIEIVERFADLARIGNSYARVSRAAFFERILCTADLTELLLGFRTTARGMR
jgi:hypothetical protein